MIMFVTLYQKYWVMSGIRLRIFDWRGRDVMLKATYRGKLFKFALNVAPISIFFFIQTETERRRREAGDKQSMEIGVRSCMWVGMYGIWNYLANQGT